MASRLTGGFGISPSSGNFLTRPGYPPRDIGWEVVEPGWGQFPTNIVIEWGGPLHPCEIRVAEAPIITERFDHPNLPRKARP